MAKEAVLRHSAKAAAHAGTDLDSIGEGADAAIVLASVIPEVETAGPLWSQLDRAVAAPVPESIRAGVVRIALLE